MAVDRSQSPQGRSRLAEGRLCRRHSESSRAGLVGKGASSCNSYLFSRQCRRGHHSADTKANMNAVVARTFARIPIRQV